MVAGPNQYEGAGTKTVNMFSKLVSQGSSFVMEGVKNLVIKRHVRTHSLCVMCFLILQIFSESSSYQNSRSFNGV